MENGYQGEDAYREWQDRRARRVVKNEESFRAYNERRSELEQRSPDDGDPVPFVCECGDRACHQAMNLTIEEFEASHRRTDLFAVRPGHVLPEFEEVVGEHEQHWVIRKFTQDEIAERRVSPS